MSGRPGAVRAHRRQRGLAQLFWQGVSPARLRRVYLRRIARVKRRTTATEADQ